MMKKKNILYISYDGLTDPLGQSQILPYVNGLTKEEYVFTIISCEKKEPFRKNKHTISRICQENNIDWQPVMYTKKPPVISTLWDIVKLLVKIKKLYRRKDISLIHCRSYIPALIGLRFKKKYGIDFIFDMRGFWADERVDGNIWSLKNPIFRLVYGFFKKKEKDFLSYATKIVSLTKAGKREILSWGIKNLAAEKIVVIPCAADYDLFELINADKKRQAKINLGLQPNQFVLSYIGSVGTWYMADEMFHFFSLLKKTNNEAKFLLLTPEKKDFLVNLAIKHDLSPEDIIIKFSNRKQIPSYAHASDFSIFFIKPFFSKKASSPTKMGELMAMGIPIICNSNVGDVEEIMKLAKSGICIEEMNAPNYQNVVDRLKSWNESSPEEIRKSSKPFYDLKNGLNLYLEIYKQILG